MKPLNLAALPVRNERLPATLLGLLLVVVVAGTVHHARVLRGLLSERTSIAEKEAAALEEELAGLEKESRSLTAPRPEKATLAEWAVLRGLVDHRSFSWTRLFGRLEQMLPTEIRLVSVGPQVRDGELWLDVSALARNPDDVLTLMRSLQNTEEFADVALDGMGEGEHGVEFTWRMRYRPGVFSGRMS